jgi:hypothetical protein
MLEIDLDLFIKNLLQTQEYCHIQMNNLIADDVIIDNTSVFRSFNPEINEREIIEFGIEEFRNNDNTVNKLVKAAYWTTNPFSDTYLNKLYLDQQAYKDKCFEGISLSKKYSGEIVISQFDISIVDGASASASDYLFDDYDLPPIDTWFYLIKTPETRLIFAWIPEKYIPYVDDAIAVNCVDCIDWFGKMYPTEYKLFYKKLFQLK